MRKSPVLIFLLFGLLTAQIQSQTKLEIPDLILSKIPFNVSWHVAADTGLVNLELRGGLDGTVVLDGIAGEAEVRLERGQTLELVEDGRVTSSLTPNVIPAWLSIIPPLLAIVLALATREMLLALFAGIWVGVTVMYGFRPIKGFLTSLDTYIIDTISNPGHAMILLFTFGFGGLVGLIQRNGGLAGIVGIATRWAKTRRRGQLATAFMGLLVFFDDYANSLLVGNTMRPFTDKLRISREKLSYIVDSTAAPVASVGLISTWIVFAMSLLDGQLKVMGIKANAYLIFLLSIPFSFYAILAIIHVFLNVITRREYGPMYQAEVRAITEGKVLRPGAHPLADDSATRNAMPENIPHRWFNAVVPIATVILITILGMAITGMPDAFPADAKGIKKLLVIMDATDSSRALLWGSYIAAAIAMLMTLGQKLMGIKRILESWFEGARTMFLAAIILVLAWSLGSVCTDIHTADFIVYYTRDLVTIAMLPTLSFIIAALISFATGTSYGTMSILMPLIVPLAIELQGGDVQNLLFWATFAAIISGATFGDHCSPISDTTILSSLASGADNVDHVSTQLPYALVVGLTAVVFGFVPIGLFPGLPYAAVLILYAIASTVLYLVLRFAGKLLPRRSNSVRAEA